MSLLYYAEIADPTMKQQVFDTVKKSLAIRVGDDRRGEQSVRLQPRYVQDKTGARRTSFFFPHNSDAAPWWQGENARLASLATAARLAERVSPMRRFRSVKLEAFATNQLNWILGLNPFDSCMLNGVGRNNPRYMFFDSWEFTNAPGGISNGITSGFRDETISTTTHLHNRPAPTTTGAGVSSGCRIGVVSAGRSERGRGEALRSAGAIGSPILAKPRSTALITGVPMTSPETTISTRRFSWRPGACCCRQPDSPSRVLRRKH